MLRLTNEKFSKLDVGTTVRVRIPDVDRARGSPQYGVLKHKYTRAQISPCKEKFLELDEAMKKIKDKEITLREAAGHGIAGHQGFNRCNCKTGCGTKKCACNAAEMLCSSKCHAYYIIANAKKKREKKRSKWIKNYFKTRNFGIINDLQLDGDFLFGNFTRMSKTIFFSLLKMIEPDIVKQNTKFREALPSNALEWKLISDNYNKRWNFPHCIGALDGKHVVIQKPENTVSEFYNYKGTNSIVLMAIADANYCFIYVDVGCQGRISDGGVFKNTSFSKKMEKNELSLPPREALPGRTMPVPYVLVADDAFSLSENIMKPYRTDLKNSFALLLSVFRVFHQPIEVKIEETVVNIVLSCVYLHNFLRIQSDSTNYYSTSGCFDSEDASTGEIIPGSWREIKAGDTGLRPLRVIPRRSSNSVQGLREEFKSYFTSDIGSVLFQNKYL
ncbi:hypothetical protein QTP88_001968 [Uroleucon formosanum]